MGNITYDNIFSNILINSEPMQSITSISSDGNTIKINYDKNKEEKKMGEIKVDGKNLFDGTKLIDNIYIKGDGEVTWNKLCSTVPCTPYVKYDPEEDKEEENEMEVLDIYEEREIKLITEKSKEVQDSFIEKDPFTKLTQKYNEEIKKLYKKEYEEDLKINYDLGLKFTSKATKEALEKVKEEENFELHNLHETLKEVRARLDMTDDYDKQVEILKAYKILDEEGRINA